MANEVSQEIRSGRLTGKEWILGKGTHEQLMKTCRVYQEIALSQLSKEELGYAA